jgi:hypothetical protein
MGEIATAVNDTRARGDIKSWLLKKDAYAMHRPERKPFHIKPYSVDNIIDVRNCDLVDVQALAKYDSYRYLVTVINVF